jgi:glycosyltransferase involved in cell wall biosynthesis
MRERSPVTAMRIDLVFPKFKLLSGAERLILDLGSALAGRGHRVRIVCHRFHPSCRPLAEKLVIEETGDRLEWTGNHYLDSIASYVQSFRLRRRIDRAADAVCLFGPALPLAAWRPRGPKHLLYFCYEPPRAASVDEAEVLARVGVLRFVLAPALRLYRRIDRWLVGRVDSILVSGPFGADLVRAEYGRASWIVTPGVSLDGTPPDRRAARAAIGLDEAARVVLTVNFLHPRKRLDLLLRGWARVEAGLRDAVLLIVGDGPERSALEALARGLGLEHVRFCGFVPEAELPLYYAAADLLTHVARLETFGFTVIEAGAFRVPVVVADEGGPRHTVVPGETGILVTANEAPLAEALAELLSDPERARTMGERGREHALRHYTWGRGAEEFLAAVDDLERAGHSA